MGSKQAGGGGEGGVQEIAEGSDFIRERLGELSDNHLTAREEQCWLQLVPRHQRIINNDAEMVGPITVGG